MRTTRDASLGLQSSRSASPPGTRHVRIWSAGYAALAACAALSTAGCEGGAQESVVTAQASAVQGSFTPAYACSLGLPPPTVQASPPSTTGAVGDCPGCTEPTIYWEPPPQPQPVWVIEPLPSPLVFNFCTNQPIKYLGHGVPFDLYGDGTQPLLDWITPSFAFLALPDANGQITSGLQLFGTETPLGCGVRAGNGFLALAQYDVNLDGQIDANDAVFPQLVLWFDLDSDGVAQSSEQLTLAQAGVTSISLRYDQDPIPDAGVTGVTFVGENGVFYGAPGGAIEDVYFHVSTPDPFSHGACSLSDPPDAVEAPATTPTSLMDGTTGLCLYSENIQGYGLLEIDCTTSVTDQSQWLVAQPGQAGSLMNAPTPDLGNNESCVQIDTSGETGMGVLMAECNGGTTQQWVQQADGSLVNASSGQCLSYWTSTAAGNVGNSPVVGVWDCAGGPWTNWYDKAGQWKTVYLSAVTPPPPSTGGGHHHH